MLLYDVYIMLHGENYYKRYRLKGREERFADLEELLSIYSRAHLIDGYFMFELEDTEDDE